MDIRRNVWFFLDHSVSERPNMYVISTIVPFECECRYTNGCALQDALGKVLILSVDALQCFISQPCF